MFCVNVFAASHIRILSKSMLKGQVHGSAHAHLLNYVFLIYYQFYRLIIRLTCISAISECISLKKCILEQPEVGWRSTKIAEKLVDHANTTNIEFIVDPRVSFRG